MSVDVIKKITGIIRDIFPVEKRRTTSAAAEDEDAARTAVAVELFLAAAVKRNFLIHEGEPLGSPVSVVAESMSATPNKYSLWPAFPSGRNVSGTEFVRVIKLAPPGMKREGGLRQDGSSEKVRRRIDPIKNADIENCFYASLAGDGEKEKKSAE